MFLHTVMVMPLSDLRAEGLKSTEWNLFHTTLPFVLSRFWLYSVLGNGKGNPAFHKIFLILEELGYKLMFYF